MWSSNVLAILWQIGLALAIETFYMDQYCNNAINMAFLDIQYGRLAIDGFYNGDCNVTIESPDTTERIHFRFKMLDFGKESDCATTFLEVYDGRDPNEDSKIHDLGHVCASNQPSDDYTSTEKFLTFHYVNKNPTLYSQMQLVFTAFHTGKCNPHEYECSNDRCISSEASCNGFDPCGDGSDCRVESDIVVAIVVGAVIGIVILGTLTYMLVRSVRKAKRSATSPQDVSYRPFEPSPAAMLTRTNHPSYGMANQYAVPSATYHVSTSLQADK